MSLHEDIALKCDMTSFKDWERFWCFGGINFPYYLMSGKSIIFNGSVKTFKCVEDRSRASKVVSDDISDLLAEAYVYDVDLHETFKHVSKNCYLWSTVETGYY